MTKKLPERILTIILALIIVSVIVLFFTWQADKRKPPVNPTVTATSVTTETPTPTATHEPDPTLIATLQPTNTPQPTHTPTVTATPFGWIMPNTAYQIEPGDTLQSIALRAYGDRELWTHIWEANKDRIPDPDKLQIGMIIWIPRLSP